MVGRDGDRAATNSTRLSLTRLTACAAGGADLLYVGISHCLLEQRWEPLVMMQEHDNIRVDIPPDVKSGKLLGRSLFSACTYALCTSIGALRALGAAVGPAGTAVIGGVGFLGLINVCVLIRIHETGIGLVSHHGEKDSLSELHLE